MIKNSHLGGKRSHPEYETNPSLGSDGVPTRIKRSSPRDMDRAVAIAGTGEIVSKGAFAFIEEREVDSEQFMKVYFAGMKAFAQLSKSGLALFEVLWQEMEGRGNKNRDDVSLNLKVANKYAPEMKSASFYRALAELLDREIIFRSVVSEVFWVNIRFIFNGDRLVMAQSYKRRPPQAAIKSDLQPELFEDKPAEPGQAG